MTSLAAQEVTRDIMRTCSLQGPCRIGLVDFRVLKKILQKSSLIAPEVTRNIMRTCRIGLVDFIVLKIIFLTKRPALRHKK
jgi:hypothetical protein